MSCFWDGLLSALTDKELASVGIVRSSTELICALQKRNVITVGVTWQGTFLNNKALMENYAHVKSYDGKTYRDGYLTSACDPFMLLFCEIFRLKIEFMYDNHKINMSHANPLRTVKFKANRKHFEHVG